MKRFPPKSLAGVVLAVSLSTLGVNGSAQAHSDIDYAWPANLLLLGAFLNEYRDHDREYIYVKPRHFASHRHGHDYKRYKHHRRHGHDGRHKSRHKSRSHGHYRDGHRGKGRYRD